MKKVTKILIIFVITLFLFSIYSFKIPHGNRKLYDEDIFKIKRYSYYISIKDKPFSEHLLKTVIWYENINSPNVVLLQAQLETGFYSSDIFLTGNNCFGMKFPKIRNTISIGEYKGHAQYEHWIDSVIDYKIWQDWYNKIGYKIKNNRNSEYMTFLKYIRYAEDPYYIHKLVFLDNLNNKDIT